MRAFSCPSCRSLLFFDNSRCVTCGTELGFLRSTAELIALESPALTAVHDGITYARCANATLATCNWLAAVSPAQRVQGLCSCCSLTRTRPADNDADALVSFARTEAAKRRLIFQLDRLGLPTTPRFKDPDRGLAFDLLSSTDGKVITGHANGVITIDLAEGDDPHREAVRTSLGEPYRTLLGHLRHEIGHWYWEVLVDGTPVAPDFRNLFGDESVDYSQALSQHYGSADDGSWSNGYVSFYAAAHPWEDWAETFAHYLHMTDTLQTANAYGLMVAGPDVGLAADADTVSAQPQDGYVDFAEMVASWLALTYALNAVNRSMGKDDLYPFLLVPEVMKKLRFVHELIGIPAFA